MKTIPALVLLGLSAFVASAQSTGSVVKLVGIVDGLGIKRAAIEVNNTNRHPAKIEQMMLGEGQAQGDVEMVAIDSEKETATIKLNGETRSLELEKDGTASAVSGPAKPAIRLRNVERQLMINLYAELKDRTVLQHPAIGADAFSLTISPKDKTEASAAVEKMFEQHGVASIPDGDKFVMLVPAALTNKVTPHSAALANNGQSVTRNSILFWNLPMPQVVHVYAEYVGRSIVNASDVPGNKTICLRQQTELSKEQLCYALETLFAWNGIRLVPEGEKTLRVEQIPSKPETIDHAKTKAR